MDLIPRLWPQLLVTLVSTVVATPLAAAAQNWAQGDDVRQCTIGGLAAGIVAGVLACVTFVIMEALTGTHP